jgi:ribonuclease HII
MPDFELELAYEGLVAGIDEAGRGPWAGPVTAGAAILIRDRAPADLLNDLDDSKKLTRDTRERLFQRLQEGEGDWIRSGIGQAQAEEIDQLNILKATFLAMRRALDQLGVLPAMALVDGNRPPPLPCPVRTVIKGDGKSLSIAAASILAKVTRDRRMQELALQYPGFGWETNAGYGTAEHQEALRRLGPTPEHRRSFRPVKELVERGLF